MISDLLGAEVYSRDDESLGEINDVMLAGQGQKPKVIIGVGGFFGIGEKDVPIDLAQLKFTTTDGGLKITLDSTKAEIESLAAR
jgi:uncharacterized protein YrrD